MSEYKEKYPTTIECDVSYKVNANGFREVYVDGRYLCWIPQELVAGPPRPAFPGLEIAISGEETYTSDEALTRYWAELSPEHWARTTLERRIIRACKKIVAEYDGENDEK